MNRGWVEGANHRSIDVEAPDSDDHPGITVLTVRGQRGGILAVVELTGGRARLLAGLLVSGLVSTNGKLQLSDFEKRSSLRYQRREGAWDLSGSPHSSSWAVWRRGQPLKRDNDDPMIFPELQGALDYVSERI